MSSKQILASERAVEERERLEARVRELERELAWVRDGRNLVEAADRAMRDFPLERMDGAAITMILGNAIRWHLDSKPPEGWKP